MPTPNIVILDTETTGLEAANDRLVELAGVGPRNDDRSQRQFTSLINPGRDIPPEARAIHHISPADVLSAPDESAALQSMLRHFEAAPDDPWVFVAHNAKFDRGFIERIAPALRAYWICTYKTSVVTWPDAPAHGNQVLRYYLGLEPDVPEGLFPHRALYDCIVTERILDELLKHHTLKELVQISSGPILLTKVSFGKHKGMLWSDVPYGYLKWVSGQSDMNEDALHTANHYMTRGSRR